MILMLLVLLQDADRTYHKVPLANLEKTSWTHVEVCGPVVYVRKQGDGDWHITLDDGTAKVVVEIIPSLPLPAPRKGQKIRVRGIARQDERHKWGEVHPAESWQPVERCQ